jgi:hypothetical protein
MRLFLQREPTVNEATFGKLSVDGTYQCETLEDAIREVPGVPVTAWKIPDQTAIPAGVYSIDITPSAHFGNRLLPLLIGVPGYDGVRIHPGNYTSDTEGCILVGLQRSGGGQGGPTKTPMLLQSRPAFESLFSRIGGAHTAGEAISIEIRNPNP